jgi:ankyrin repeat protein
MEDLMSDNRCKIDVNAKSHGNTSLMYACFHGHMEMLQWLLENGTQTTNFFSLFPGADPLIQNLNGVTALMWAVERNRFEVVEALLKHDHGKHTEKLINLKDKQGYTCKNT